MSGLPKIAAARHVRTRQPPERAAIGRARSSSEKPRLTSSVVARLRKGSDQGVHQLMRETIRCNQGRYLRATEATSRTPMHSDALG